MVTAGECNVGCMQMAKNLPVPCQVTQPTISQCGASAKADAIAPFCDIQIQQKKTTGLNGFNNVIAKIENVNMFYAKPYGFNCTKGMDNEANCAAGRALFGIVNCGFMATFASKSYNSICTLMVGGLMNMSTGFLMFFLGYNMAFFVFLLGYKRWNVSYIEGYRVDLDGDGKTDGDADGYISEARGETAGVGDDQKKGMIGAMCDSLKQGCKGQYHPKEGDTLVFGDGDKGFTTVTEAMSKKKSGYALSKNNAVVPDGGGEAASSDSDSEGI
jgi:hypothetical protein